VTTGFYMSKTNNNAMPAFRFTCFKDLEKLFGPPPILQGEDPEAYLAIGQALWDARQPADFIEASWVNDIAYHLWEGSRLRRLKVKLIDASKVEGATKLIRRLSGEFLNAAFWSGWALGEQENVDYVNSLLTSAGLDQDAILAQTVETIVDKLDAIERQSAQLEARRLVTIRDFDQYRDNALQRSALLKEPRKELSSGPYKKGNLKEDQDAVSAKKLSLDLEAAE
jgi:hypothetical protein